ncbi:MAG: PIG-L family deacetylase, partial [Bacteroidota bacterium]
MFTNPLIKAFLLTYFKKLYRLSFLFYLAFQFLHLKINAQAGPKPQLNAAEIKLALKKLQVLGSVLYVAAHPDDENTRMITYLANERGVRTAYLSLTRGDGGQNLIGKEVREQMGIIRTQELLAARRKDGGEQFFSRANDFGYSKHPNETLQIWDKEKVLSDVVWIIRNFKPDVIITRFSPDRDGKTHGHHTTSAKIALEAFSVSGDENRFVTQLNTTTTWQATRIAWNTSSWFFRTQKNYDLSKLLKLNVGKFNPLLGKYYGEIAAESRTMHKSQGFGSSKQRGDNLEYFEHLAGDSAVTDILEGVDLSWNKVEGSERLSALLKKADSEFDMLNPESIVPILLEAHKAIEALPKDNHYVKIKKKELEELILQCAGIWVDATSKSYMLSPGDSLFVEARILQSSSNVKIKFSEINFQFGEQKIDSLLTTNQIFSLTDSLIIPEKISYSQPYWLVKASSKGMFKVDNQELIGKPENDAPIQARFVLKFDGGTEIGLNTPVMYRSVDPVDGEVYRPIAIAPPITTNIAEQVYIYANNEAKPVNVLLKAVKAPISGKLKLNLPSGWQAEPAFYDFNLTKKLEEVNYSFLVKPVVASAEGEVKAIVELQGKSYDFGLKIINYPHIPVQTLFPKAVAKLVKIDINKAGNRIGYVMGAGDAVPEALRQIGFQVDILQDQDFVPTTLLQYDAIIMGVRAYNTNKRLKFHHSKLMNYVEKGGNLIVQYNTTRGLATDQLGPYSLKIS